MLAGNEMHLNPASFQAGTKPETKLGEGTIHIRDGNRRKWWLESKNLKRARGLVESKRSFTRLLSKVIISLPRYYIQVSECCSINARSGNVWTCLQLAVWDFKDDKRLSSSLLVIPECFVEQDRSCMWVKPNLKMEKWCSMNLLLRSRKQLGTLWVSHEAWPHGNM